MVTRALVLFALVGCKPTIPEGKLECSIDDDCPRNWHCWSDQRCYSDPEDGLDAGLDASTDSSVDVPTDSSEVDAPADTAFDAGLDTAPDTPPADTCVLNVPAAAGRMLLPPTTDLWPDEFTWEMWVRFDTFAENSTSRLFFVTAEGGGLFYMRRFMGSLQCVYGQDDTMATASATPEMATGVWYHVACTRDDSGLSLYFDGERQATAAATPFTPPTSEIGIGGDYRTPPEFSGDFIGAIDDVRVSDVVRYSETFEPESQLTADVDTVALWKFSECSGSTAEDESSTYTGMVLDGAGFTTESR